MLRLSFKERVHVPAVSTKKPDFSSLKKEEVKEEFENTIKRLCRRKKSKQKRIV